MDENRDVLPISALIGKVVLSLATGNKVGEVQDLFIDPLNGILLGLTIAGKDGNTSGLGYDEVYSFGHDAIMVKSDASVHPIEQLSFAGSPNAGDLINTKIISESGNLVGQITNVFVTLKPPPLIAYSVRENNMLDKLLGREFFILAASGHALSDDRERLVVPNETAKTASPTIAALINKDLSVGAFPARGSSRTVDRQDDTLVTRGRSDDLETFVTDNDDDTVIRLRRDPDLGPSTT